VLQVVYLVFNEGYSAAAGAEVTRAEITGEAIRLGRLLAGLQPEPEVNGLLALMLLQESRRAARRAFDSGGRSRNRPGSVTSGNGSTSFVNCDLSIAARAGRDQPDDLATFAGFQ